MLMTTKIDFHQVEAKHQNIHAELENWARWVQPGRQSWMSPMFRQYRSRLWVLSRGEYREPCLPIPAMKMEVAVGNLPEKHRYAIRWAYVWKWSPTRAMKETGSTNDALMLLLRDGRQMLVNKSPHITKVC